MERGHTIKVLDHGFVKLVDWMGSDEAIVEAARMSTGRGFISWEPYRRCKKCDVVALSVGFTTCQLCGVKTNLHHSVCPSLNCEHDWQNFPRGDLGLLEFMYKNKHATSFEFCELHVEVQAPIFVFREWHRHRTFSYSEFSARYSQMPDLHYLPEPERIQMQSKTNQQGAGEAMADQYTRGVCEEFAIEQLKIYKHYDALVREGVAKEVARLNTPVSRYSKMRAKTDLRNWLGFLLLRMSPSAQWEIRQYACAAAEIVHALWPRTYALFEEYDLFGIHLSRTEARALAVVCDRHAGEPIDKYASDAIRKLTMVK